MAGMALPDGPGGRASRFLDAVVAFVAAVFQPIFHVLVSVISPSNSTSREQHHRAKSQPRKPDKDPSASEEQQNKRHDASTTTSHDGDLGSSLDPHPDHDSQSMAPPLQNQSLTSNWSRQPMEVKTNGQAPSKVALPRLDPIKQPIVKQENVPASGSGGVVKPIHSDDRDLANATVNEPKYLAVGDEQAQENRQDQLTLPPPVCGAKTAHDNNDGRDDEPEDPATAAERAIHHGFMHQALDMVCYFCLLIS